MVRGLFGKLQYPYAQFACANLSGDQMFDPVWQAISRLERLGFCVLALMCDGASPNRKLLKLHSKGDDMVYKVPNPYANDSRYLYFISDPPHLLKTIRNSWFNSKRKLWVRNVLLYNLVFSFLCSVMEKRYRGSTWRICIFEIRHHQLVPGLYQR